MPNLFTIVCVVPFSVDENERAKIDSKVVEALEKISYDAGVWSLTDLWEHKLETELSAKEIEEVLLLTSDKLRIFIMPREKKEECRFYPRALESNFRGEIDRDSETRTRMAIERAFLDLG